MPSHGPMKTVLIIDDDTDYRKLMAEILELKGWKVLSAGEGEQGIELARQQRPDAVVCDLLMPRCNGFQVCRALRSDPALRQTRIFVTSGRIFESDRQAAMVAGADEYLTKPIDPAELAIRLARSTGLAVPAPNPVLVPQGAKPSPATIKFWGVRGSIPTPGP